jgi:dipeptidyl aminopeptidase/acylaminoacyl peptidase
LNLQQSDYVWGDVELYKWEAYDGTDMEGLLYKPSNFDSTKKYPMIVYFYEKYSDNLHRYYVPKPSHSTINFTEYVSNGYVIFVPDIVYQTGKPGESAYNCIVSGTKSLMKENWIDTNKIGIQGQSWGGYQVAYLITRTNIYAAAESGAPVSNMTSAYGGIRWGSGMSRAFQYEKGQSRIGVDMWTDLDLYIENSPIFFADKVETPLLIMHNTKDGAVPWSQGIEYFSALRRLDKKVWMLSYDDDHNLMKWPNRVDLNIRMKQFFDYYLKDEQMPLWMKEGLPYSKKGKEDAYELVE